MSTKPFVVLGTLIQCEGIYFVNARTYLLFVTDTTDGVCVKKMPGVNFYRFNAKNWQFTVYFAVITQKIGNLLCILS